MDWIKQFSLYLLFVFGKFVYCYHNPCNSRNDQSDIVLPLNVQRRNKRAVTSDQNKLWHDGIVPYEISDKFHGREKLLIHKAIHHWQLKTCILFIPRTNEKEYVNFQKQSTCGCCSFVGRVGKGEPQGVNLSPECITFGTILHEIGHVVGFWHEHTRPDRDTFLQIFPENITPGELKNFRKKSSKEINSLGVEYDYTSLMHYGRSTFSRSYFAFTILPKDDIATPIGQREHLSYLDAKQANLLYRCPTFQRTFTTSNGSIKYILNASFTGLKSYNMRIVAPEGHHVLIYFEYLNFQLACPRSYMKISEGRKKIKSYCRDKQPPNLFISKKNHFSLNFIYKKKLFYDGEKKIGFIAKYRIFCGGDILEDSGTIQSPNYPSVYDNNQICEWEIKVPLGYIISFKFDILKLERSPRCKNDYIEVVEERSDKPFTRRFCRLRDAKNIRTTSNIAKIRFRSNEDVTKAGFSLTFKKELNQCSLNNGNCSHICVSTKDNIKCKCEAGYELQADGNSCMSICNQRIQIIPGQKGFIKTPVYPDSYKTPTNCSWNIVGLPTFNIILMIKDYQAFLDSNGRVEVYKENEKIKEINKMILKQKPTFQMKFPGPDIIIRFITDGHNQFTAEYMLEKDVCLSNNGNCQHVCNSLNSNGYCSCYFGYILSDDNHTCKPGNCIASLKTPNGWIASPNYPSIYGHGETCLWRLTTVPGHKLVFTIEEDLQKRLASLSSKCSLYLSNDKWSKDLNMCKNNNKIESFSHMAKLKFKQQSTQSKMVKFNISYHSECGGSLEALKTSQMIYSHLRYNKEITYPENQHCIWRIKSHRKKQRVLLNFKYFNLENEPCRFDYVTIYDGPDQNYPIIAKLCGSKLKHTFYLSTSNEILVIFKTDSSVAGKGFQLDYKRTKLKLVDKTDQKVIDKHNFGRRRDFYVFDNDDNT